MGSESTLRFSLLFCGAFILACGNAAIFGGCPAPCECVETNISCKGCPKNYLTISIDTTSLFVNNCDNIEYLLRLHPHAEKNQTGGALVRKIEITDSVIEKVTTNHINPDLNVTVLILKNDSIDLINADLVAHSLVFFDISCNNLSVIENRTFETFDNLIYLDLSNNLLSDLNEGSFTGLDRLQHLDLSNNNLTELKVGTFQTLSLMQKLNLSSNKLATLCERCLGSLVSLQQLDLSFNRLTNLAPGTLQFLPNLSRLLLANNPQLKPDAQTFVGTSPQLQQVDASRTGLSQVPESLTHSVRYLTLAGNRISTVRCGDMDSYPLLHMLDFADNKIDYIEDDALGRLEILTEAFFNINLLKSVPKMLPDKLTHLSFDRNLIANLTANDFPNLIQLKVLILSNNLISYIDENVFTELKMLEVLDVSRNPLKILTPNAFNGPTALKDIRLAFVNASVAEKDISFPVPFPEYLENLYLQYSPGLTNQLLTDAAALAAMTNLKYLDVRFSNVTNLRSDLLKFFPQLKALRLDGNHLNCTGLDWLSEWMRDNPTDEYKEIKCQYPKNMTSMTVLDLSTVKVQKHQRSKLKIFKSKIEKGSFKKTSTKTLREALIAPETIKKIFEDPETNIKRNIETRGNKEASSVKETGCGYSNGTENNSECENKSETETPRFMYRKIGGASETGAGSQWLVILASGGGVIILALGILWKKRSKRSRASSNGNQGEVMEVQAISAVGELW